MFNNITYTPWGEADQQPVYLFRITNSKGAYIELTNYGASLVSIYVPDKDGILGNVILGYATLENYINDHYFMGATIGRFANRIHQANFMLDGVKYNLDDNDNGNSNHGGKKGFNKRVFTYEINSDVLSFSLLSEDRDCGFPGNLNLTVSYRWDDNNELSIDYTATSDRPTPANFTNHAYFNLTSGIDKILDHQLIVCASSVVEADHDYIPTGILKYEPELLFHGNKIREKIQTDGSVISGLNVCYVLDQNPASLRPACKFYEANSGRAVEIFTTYPGLIVYTGDYLSGSDDYSYQPFDGMCLECQHFPDSPNHPDFPSAILRPGEVYNHSILFKFSKY